MLYKIQYRDNHQKFWTYALPDTNTTDFEQARQTARNSADRLRETIVIDESGAVLAHFACGEQRVFDLFNLDREFLDVWQELQCYHSLLCAALDLPKNSSFQDVINFLRKTHL